MGINNTNCISNNRNFCIIKRLTISLFINIYYRNLVFVIEDSN